MKPSDLKFVVDVGVSKKIENYMCEEGFNVKTVRDIDPCMTDHDIIQLANKEERIIITMDKDFGELVYHALLKHSGIILLRLENATGSEKLKIMKEILDKYSDKLRNHFCVYQKGRFRIRKTKTEAS
jgi:predicted nuclease of predicted toxin-antitoxin system